MNSFLELTKQRFAVRAFKTETVPKDELKLILEAVQAAPTAKNMQPVHIYVLESKEALQTLDQQTPCRYKAGTVLLFAYNKDEDRKNPEEEGIHSGVEDASFMATHAMLEAADLGIDSIWINLFSPTKLAKALNLPHNEIPVLLLSLGHRIERIKPTSMHSARKSIDDLVTYL